MCGKFCCTDTTRHAIIFLSILSLLLLINAPSLHLTSPSSSKTNHKPPPVTKMGGNTSPSPPPPPPSPPCTTNHNTNTNTITAFLYGVLFTSVFVMVIIATNHLPDDTDPTGPPSWGGALEGRPPPHTAAFLRPTTTTTTTTAASIGGGTQEDMGGVGNVVLRTLPTFAYSSRWRGRLGKDARFCVICQRKFRDAQMLRWLPDCDHLFHLPCIDEWLATHKSCPCCRADLVLLTIETNSEYGDHYYEFPF